MKKNRVFLILVVSGILFLLFSSKNKVDRQVSSVGPTEEAAVLSLINEKVLNATQPSISETDQDRSDIEPVSKKTQLSPAEINELRAKTKNFLATLYTSQIAFHSEYNQFITDVVAIGINTDTVLPFKAGFLEHSDEPLEIPNDANIDSRRLTTDSIIGEIHSQEKQPIQYAPHVREIDLSRYRDLCVDGCTARKNSFEMLVATPLGNSDQVDIWIVNEGKEFILVKDGTESKVE
jgi:hypothetical protein